MDTTAPAVVELEQLVRRHQRMVRGFLSYLGCPAELADDLVQETFLSVLASGFQQRSEAATAAFLRKVARHLLYKALERERRRPVPLDLEHAEAAWRELERDDGGASYLDALRECLQGLRGRGAEVIQLHYRDGLERKSIGERLGLTESGVKAILVRARAWLRACVQRRFAS